MKKAILKKIFLINSVFSLLLPINSMADNNSIFTKILNARPGDNVAGDMEGKDIDKFLKPGECKNHYPWGAPKLKDESVNKRSLYICGVAYASQYDPKLKVALWTSERLDKSNYEIEHLKHSYKLHLDDELPSKMQQSPEDYIKSDYYPKQFANEQNITINNLNVSNEELKRVNKIAVNESFRFSNIAPLLSENKKIWEEMDEYTLNLISKNERLYIVTGAIYLNGKTNGQLKKSGALIPTHYYKIIVNPETHGSVNYIIPNKPIEGKASLSEFSVSIKEIERITNIEFFPELAPTWAAQIKLNKGEYYKIEAKKQERKNPLNEK